MNTATPAPTRNPRGVLRRIPFWALVVASLVTIAVGAWIALSQVDTMTTALTAGTATGVEVYAGQSLAVVGAVVLGAGIGGLLLALGVAAIGSLIPVPAIAVLEPAPWEDDATVADEPATPADAAHDVAVAPDAAPAQPITRAPDMSAPSTR